MANKVKKEGGINLAQGIPAFQPPKELIQALSNCVEQPVHQYAPGTGNLDLIKQLEVRYEEFGLDATNFLITNGATEAISLLYTYIHKLEGKEFTSLAFDPVYESYKHLPRIFNAGFVAFPLGQDLVIDFDALEERIRNEKVRLIFISSPGNPLGKIWSREELERIVKIAANNHCYIIIDAVYYDLYFDKKPWLPLMDMPEHVFYVNAFSKKFSITGWRIGYMATHASHQEAIRDIHDYIGLCAPSVFQQALALYLQENNWGKEYCSWINAQLKKNYRTFCNALSELGFTVQEAQGGYFVWCALPEKYKNGFEFAVELYEKEKVAVVPGIHFTTKGGGFIRVNIARTDEEIEEGVKRIRRFVNSEISFGASKVM
jgi:aspartate/methionine/tyrosine aminotransferase